MKLARLLGLIALTASGTACTEALRDDGTFRFAQEEITVPGTISINTKIDLLWVVDNSASMDVAQEKLRNGMAGFAQKYMSGTWDIRVAVITTDTYLANSIYSTYLDTTLTGSTGWPSPHIAANGFDRPADYPDIVNPTTGVFASGITRRNLVPAWNTDYAKLLPGNHDGPVAGLCVDIPLYHFFEGLSQCAVRDVPAANQGTSNCLNPGGGEDSVEQCVNTVANNSVRSGNPIIDTKNDGLSEQQLIDDFMVNITTGSNGHGSERGLSSVLQFLNDNEATGSETAFFRQGSLRGIIFVADEDDQSMTPSADPTTDYAAGNCSAKTVDSHTYTLSSCADPSKLIPVGDVKSSMDTFFNELDEGTNPNYFVVNITPLTGASIQSLQAARDAVDDTIGRTNTVDTDRGDRYMELASLVANDSMNMDIGESDYSVMLDTIGATLLSKKSRFTLPKLPTAQEDMIVKILKGNGSVIELRHDQYSIEGYDIVITDSSLVLGLTDGDNISINFQPKNGL